MDKETRLYYFSCMNDLHYRIMTPDQARQYLKLYEEIEEYEACEGIKLAIEDYEQA